MSHRFHNLSSADFEDLARDLIGKEIGSRFEAFSAGPDGGIDGRHSSAPGKSKVILQAKHFEGSTISKLEAAMRKERPSIDRLKSRRYILATSKGLTPPNKASLASIIGPPLRNEHDIFGAEDLNGLLRKYPDIEKAHIKLWLSSAAILERIVRSASHAYAEITKEEIEGKLKVYVQNPSFSEAAERLDKHHLLIISGPPGVGKTTLGEMLAYSYLSKEWELVPIRSLEDGFAAIVDTKNQVFLFDDFLGKIALDQKALAAKDSDLSRFMNRVRRSKNARFILTTRAYILQDATRHSENLADKRLDVTKYVLDVGVYARRIKARILYNHLLVAQTPIEHVRALIGSGKIPKIVDHKNYNPRVIEWMTDADHIEDIPPDDYANAFLETLRNPKQLWDKAFRTHIDDKCRHLLFAMFFCSEYGVQVAELKVAYDALHSALCTKYGNPRDPKDFEEALKTLEGGFVNITGRSVSYVNPSVRDYLNEYLSDDALLEQFGPAAQKADYAQRLWKFAAPSPLDQNARRRVAMTFVDALPRMNATPMWVPNPDKAGSLIIGEASISARIKLILDWWSATHDVRFADAAVAIATKPQGWFSAWTDGASFIELLRQLADPRYFKGFPYVEELGQKLEAAVLNVMRGAPADDLERMSDAMEEDVKSVNPDLVAAIRQAIVQAFDDIEDRIAGQDSESTLEDHIASLKKLAPRANVPREVIRAAESKVKARITVIEENRETAGSPEIGERRPESDRFSDTDLRNLFAPLLVN
jgi:hypothetical protein